MFSHFGLHRLGGAIVAVSCVFLVACGGAKPRVNVLGVSEARNVASGARNKLLVVFVEVVNPTSRDLELSRLEYDLESPSWFSTQGNVRLGRAVRAGSSAVVEIPVPVKRAAMDAPRGAAYQLQGKLFARDDSRERSWKVSVKGALSKSASNRVRLNVADAE